MGVLTRDIWAAVIRDTQGGALSVGRGMRAEPVRANPNPNPNPKP